MIDADKAAKEAKETSRATRLEAQLCRTRLNKSLERESYSQSKVTKTRLLKNNVLENVRKSDRKNVRLENVIKKSKRVEGAMSNLHNLETVLIQREDELKDLKCGLGNNRKDFVAKDFKKSTGG